MKGDAHDLYDLYDLYDRKTNALHHEELLPHGLPLCFFSCSRAFAFRKRPAFAHIRSTSLLQCSLVMPFRISNSLFVVASPDIEPNRRISTSTAAYLISMSDQLQRIPERTRDLIE